MLTNKKGELEYLTFEKLSGVKHCFSTRYGGVSSGCYKSLNLAFREDSSENVIENYSRICNAIGVEHKNTVWTKQVHEDNILIVTEKDRGKGLFYPTQQEGYDGVLTNCEDVVLTGFSADCVLLYFYEPNKKVVGITHSGWRGTVKNIGLKTVEKMVQCFDAKKEDIIVGISPAMGVCHFQVDKQVVDEFLDKLPWSEKYINKDLKNIDKFYIDLHSINEEILIRAGVSADNIENSKICTMCDTNRFYSHRVMGSERGSLAGFIALD